MSEFTLTLQCANRPGIVAAVARRIADCGGDIHEAQQFDDREARKFFMRVRFSAAVDLRQFERQFEGEADQFGMAWRVRPVKMKQRVVVLVSRFDHCLGDLLYRSRIGELAMTCEAIVSNHPREALHLIGDVGIPYHHFPVSADTKGEQEKRIRGVIESTQADLIILARYMQVLSSDFAGYLAGRCINIHHSFLPGFKGAKPYHQAFERGVKMIGATAHYVTPDLDEGPIIAQDVEPVSHDDLPADLIRKGRDIERRVLARAVGHHLENRVLIDDRKTIVFAR